MHAQVSGAVAHKARIEIGGFEQDLGALLSDLRIGAAHDAGDGDRGAGIGDDEDPVVRQSADLAVEGAQGLAGATAPHDDATPVQPLQVEGVEWLAELEHNEICHIHDVVDGALSDGSQTILQPCWRGPDANTTNDTGNVTPTTLGILDGDTRRLLHGGTQVGQLRLRQAQLDLGQGGYLAGDADDAEAVGSVWRDFKIDDCVVETCRRREGGAGNPVVWQHHDAIAVVAETEFDLGADHALGGDAAQLRLADLRAIRQLTARQDDGNGLAGGDIRGATDDGARFGLTGIDTAHREAVGIGVGLALEHLADDDTGQRRSQILDTLCLEAGHGQALDKLLHTPVDVDILAQPLQRDLHFTSSLCELPRQKPHSADRAS